MAVVSIDYDDPADNEIEYDGVILQYGDNKHEVFKNGCLCIDWYLCNKFIIHNIGTSEPVSHSSTVDHFIMDGAPYDSAYLKVDNDIPKLYYIYDNSRPGIEFFVPQGTKPTWEELRKMCGDESKIIKNI